MAKRVGKRSKREFTEGSIRPDELMKENDRLHALDLKDLRKMRGRFVRVKCPACESKTSRPLWKKDGFDYVECVKCGTAYLNPRPTPEMLKDYYQNARNYVFWGKVVFPRTEEARRENLVRPRVGRILDICRRHGVHRGTLIDVGAGAGTFCEEMLKDKAFASVVAVEPTPDLAALCRGRGVEVIQLPVEEVETGAGTADAVVTFEVIEHLFSPKEFLDGCHRVLKKGGLLVLTCPNLKGFDVMTLGSISQVVDVEHLNYFHPKSIADLLERHGFEVLEVQTPGRLDAEIVRKRSLAGLFDLRQHPFLWNLLVEEWDRLGAEFQNFLSDNMLSSHMWVVARKRAR
jgi:uncharacterized metal-binding protein (TIGR02443 family)